jgi:hypothetical protein
MAAATDEMCEVGSSFNFHGKNSFPCLQKKTGVSTSAKLSVSI